MMIAKASFAMFLCGHAFRTKLKPRIGEVEEMNVSGKEIPMRRLDPLDDEDPVHKVNDMLGRRRPEWDDVQRRSIHDDERRSPHPPENKKPTPYKPAPYKEEKNNFFERIPVPLRHAGVFFIVVALVLWAWLCCLFCLSPEEEVRKEASINPNAEMVLYVKRKSGAPVTTVRACYGWSVDKLRPKIVQHLAPGEYLHSMLFEANSCVRRLEDYYSLSQSGLENGSELIVVLLSRYALPSGVSLFTFKKRIPGPHGAMGQAKLWIHEDKSASMECGEFIDVGMSSVEYLEGTLNEKRQVHFRHGGRDIAGDMDEFDGIKRIHGLDLPTLGSDVLLRQDRPDAVFDVSQTSAFVGWISMFDSCEMVAKLAKKEPEGSSSDITHLRLKMFTERNDDGSLNVNFQGSHDFAIWNGEERPGVAGSSLSSAKLTGPVGRRKLVLEHFPVVGSVDLIETQFCSDMVGFGDHPPLPPQFSLTSALSDFSKQFSLRSGVSKQSSVQ